MSDVEFPGIGLAPNSAGQRFPVAGGEDAGHARRQFWVLAHVEDRLARGGVRYAIAARACLFDIHCGVGQPDAVALGLDQA